MECSRAVSIDARLIRRFGVPVPAGHYWNVAKVFCERLTPSRVAKVYSRTSEPYMEKCATSLEPIYSKSVSQHKKGLNRYSVTKLTSATTMSKPTTTVSIFFLIFGDVVGNNVLDQSLEGLEKICSAGCDITTAMFFLHVTHGPWRSFLKQTRVFSGTKQETFPLYIATMDERVESAAASLRADRSGKMTSSLAMQFAENEIFMRASLRSLSRRKI
eukprot:scaffold57416_cov80-Attheya_sp.AAC.1